MAMSSEGANVILGAMAGKNPLPTDLWLSLCTLTIEPTYGAADLTESIRVQLVEGGWSDPVSSSMEYPDLTVTLYEGFDDWGTVVAWGIVDTALAGTGNLYWYENITASLLTGPLVVSMSFAIGFS